MNPISNPELTVSIINYKTYEFLCSCLNSIYNLNQDCSIEVIVVDNDPDLANTKSLSQNFPGVRIIANSQNLFFPHAHNQSLQVAAGNYFLVLNPDTEIPAGTLSRVLNHLKTSPDIGAIGCREIRPDGDSIPTGASFPSPWIELIEETDLSSIYRLRKYLNEYRLTDWDRQSSRDLDVLTNCFLMFPTDLLRKLGGHDERFLLYFTEYDICKRIWDSGYRVHFVAEDHYIHHGQRSTVQIGTQRYKEIYRRDMLAYYEKHFGRLRTTLLRLAIPMVQELIGPALGFYRKQRFGKEKSKTR